MTYVSGVAVLIGVSVFCAPLVFRFFRYLPLFLPIATALILIFLFFGNILGLWHLVPRHLMMCLSSVIFVYCIAIFLFSHVAWLLAFCDFNFLTNKSRFPLDQIEWVGVDDKETVYCLSVTYSRIQVFNSEGKFLRGWFVRIPRGGYQISLSKDANVVLGKNGKAYHVYDQFGKLKSPEERHSRILIAERSRKAMDAKGNTYELKSPLIRPHILKEKTNNGTKFILTKDPIGLWFHTTPFPFWIFLIVGALNYFCWRYRFK